jgi:hypothetical protein
MLISMLCDMINSKPEKDKPSENNAASRYAASFSCRHPGTVVVFVSITLLLSVLPRPSQNNFFVVVDLLLRTLYLFAALRILRLADADPIPLLALSGRQ